MYVCMCVCVCVCVCVCMHVCIYALRPNSLTHTIYHAVKDFINFLLSFCCIRGLTQGSPLVTTLVIYFFKIYEVITSYFFKLFFLKNYEVFFLKKI
jgi:hypothetical protein